MPTLTAARATVRPGSDAEYRALLERRKAGADVAGRRFWVFQSRMNPELYFEFCESDAGDDRTARSVDDTLLDLRLREVADYAADAGDLWDEVPLS